MSYQDLVEALTNYFVSGEKLTCKQQLGVEIEHFIVKKDTKEAVPYAGSFGIGELLQKLLAYYPGAKIKGNKALLGFSVDEFAVTLEPAAQLEISIAPLESIKEIERIYESFRAHVEDVIYPWGYECITMGYQPKSQVEDLTLIPSPRYHFMDRHMRPRSTHGVNMMRGTASTQVSVDYTDEEDFRKKIQTAYALSPYFKLLTDYCPVFEGKENTRRLMRSFIWEHMDPDRSFFIPKVMTDTFGFADYADYILNMPMMFLPEELTHEPDRYTNDLTAATYYTSHELTKDAIDHMLSKAFPDVRLKKYVEIRFADALPKETAFAYIALIKGLFYDTSFIDTCYNNIHQNDIDESQIKIALEDITKHGWEAKLYDVPLRKLHESLLEIAKQHLSKEESLYLDNIKKR